MFEVLLDQIGQYTNLLFIAVLPCVLHVYFCLRRNKWMGLILPILFFVAVVTLSLNNLFFGGDPLWVLGSFCLLNLPTIGGLMAYVLCRRHVVRKRAGKGGRGQEPEEKAEKGSRAEEGA